MKITTNSSEYSQLYAKWLMMEPQEFPHSGVAEDFYINPNYILYSNVGLTIGSLFLYHKYKQIKG